MSFIEQLGEQAAGDVNNAINAGIGMLFEGHNDRRQIRQQQKLTDMQLAANKSMSDFNYGKQMDMWNNTNYEAQMEHIKNAGLNPALLYGGSGAGGTTTGSGSGGGGAVGGQAPSGGGEAMGMMMQAAQMQLIKAQTKKTEQEAANIGNEGIDTQVKQTTIDSLKAGITNTEAKTALTNTQGAIEKINLIYKDANSAYQNEILEKERDIISNNLEIIQNSADISTDTKQAVIQTVKQEAINSILRGASIQSGIEVNEAQIKKMSADIVQRGQEIDIHTFEKEWKANHPELSEIGGQMINSIKEQVDKILKLDKGYKAPIKIKN